MSTSTSIDTMAESTHTTDCPTCDEPFRICCKCPDSHARCPNGHWWSRRTGEVSDGPHMAASR